MTIRRIEAGPRMSQAVIHGNTVYLAGQVGAPGKSVAEQTTAVLDSVDRLLKEAGTDKSKILQAIIWLADVGARIQGRDHRHRGALRPVVPITPSA